MSTGQYTHVTKAAGTILSADIYNTAHRNHLNNAIPASTGAWADDITEYGATTDPFPASVATPVAALSDEWQQLRFTIVDIKTRLNGGTPPAAWYVPVTATAVSLTARSAQAKVTGNQLITDDTVTPIIFDSTDYDTGVNATPFWSGGDPTKLTAPVAGLYHMNASGAWDSGAATTGEFVLAIRLNNTTYIAYEEVGANGQAAQRFRSIGTQMQLAAGDYIEFVVFETEAGGNMDFGEAKMNIVLLSSTDSITAPPAGVTVHFKMSDAPPLGGVVIIDDGTGPNMYPVVSPTNDFSTLQTSVVPDGTIVTYEVHNLVAAPYCADPGQSFSIPYTGQTITNCGSGWAYKAVVTIVASEANPGDISWTSHS